MSPANADSYEASFFSPLAAVEDRHFWFRGRNSVIAALATQLTQGLPPGYRVLEVGCGTGNVLRALATVASRGTVFGLDVFVEGLRHARRRTACPLIQGDVATPPFRVQFELIGLFDVLEHLADDVSVLRSLHNLLLPGGSLLLTVPACPSLWSHFDEVAHHRRRYEATDLTTTLDAAGFRVDYCTKYMAVLFPLVWLRRRWPFLLRRGGKAESSRKAREAAARDLTVVPLVNDLLAFWLEREAQLIRRRKRLPFGTSLVAIAKKAPLGESQTHDRGDPGSKTRWH